MKIYTRNGDEGTTQLANKERVVKNADRIEVLGTIDELNAFLGLTLAHIRNKQNRELEQQILRIQNELMLLSAIIALVPGAKKISFQNIERLEKEIDEMQISLPPMKKFVLLNANKKAAYLQVTRTVCRRAERSMVRLIKSNSEYKILLAYLNRLSDWLFVAALTQI